MDSTYPTYDDLLSRDGCPPGSSWGVFEEDPERGMANFAGPRQVREGAATIQMGKVLSLDYPVDAFRPSMSRKRTPPTQQITAAHVDSLDDVWTDFWPQVSSHVDGLRHRSAHGFGFYNGERADQISAETADLGVQRWADRPIVGRAILADVERLYRLRDAPIDHENGQALELADVRDALNAQRVSVQAGDILLLHTGWAEWFLALDPGRREEVREHRVVTGLTQSRDTLQWLWDSRIAMLGTDTFAVEALPVRPGSPFDDTGDDHGMMHQEFIAKLGLPLGELWRLAGLAEACAETGRYDFFASVKPLNFPGAVGSPANALAIM